MSQVATSLDAVREQMVREHGALEHALGRLEAMAGALEGGAVCELARVRCHARALYARLAGHLVFEDRVLLPALRAVGDDSSARSLALAHAEQREVLGLLLQHLAEARRPPALLARELIQFGGLLRDAMHDEEALVARRTEGSRA